MSQADVALLRDAYRDFSSGDFPAASQVLAPDIEWVEPGTGMPYSGTWHGPASVVNDVWTSFVQYWGGPGVVGMETDQFLDAGDHVVVTGRYTGKVQCRPRPRRPVCPCVADGRWLRRPVPELHGLDCLT